MLDLTLMLLLQTGVIWLTGALESPLVIIYIDEVAELDPLMDHFLAKYAARFGLTPCRLSPGVRARLTGQPYPGNVRELENLIERLVALAGDGAELDEQFLAQTLDKQAAVAPGEALGLKDRLEACERGLIRAELRRCGGNRSEAARQLKIGRVTLLDKLRKRGL